MLCYYDPNAPQLERQVKIGITPSGCTINKSGQYLQIYLDTGESNNTIHILASDLDPTDERLNNTILSSNSILRYADYSQSQGVILVPIFVGDNQFLTRDRYPGYHMGFTHQINVKFDVASFDDEHGKEIFYNSFPSGIDFVSFDGVIINRMSQSELLDYFDVTADSGS